jgi:acetylornithine deacetylase/succinyl-diaminopimelate desuccinylase-like protein
MFGGPLPDAMTAMIKLLATLNDEQGNVAIKGLKSVDVAELPYSDETFAEQAGMLEGVQRLGSESLLKHNWGAPSVTVIGLDGPRVETSSNTAQPSIQARISLRLAPNEDPSEGLALLKKHLVDNAPWGAKVEFGHSEKGPGYLAKQGWGSKLAHEAFSAVWPNQSVEIGIGGSIPFIAHFAEAFPEAQILVTGVEEPDSRAHSPNESQHLPTLRRAIAAQSLILLHGNSLARA